MALRVTFQEVIQATRAEAKLSSNTSRSLDNLENIKQLIRRHYTTLAEDYDWQHLQLLRGSSTARKVLQAGLRFYNWPADLNPLKIEDAWIKWGSTWQKLTFGITPANYSAMDPELNQRADPVTNWAWYGGDQFEVWPMPASNGVAGSNNEVQFTGQKKVEQLLNDNSRLDLDDIVVSLMTAAEILAGNNQKPAADVKAGAAIARLGRLRANLSDKTRYTMGRGQVTDTAYYPRHPRYIR